MEGNVKSEKTLTGSIITIPKVDETLSKEGYAADAKAVGDKFKKIEEDKEKGAEAVAYSNENSGLEAEDVQGAIDEVAENYLDMRKGGTINGSVNVKTADNGHATIMKNHSATADYGTLMADTTKDGKTAKISVSAALDLLTFTDTSSNIRDIHHEGNKPFGEYIGNGSAEARTIDTKGIGRLVLVYNKDNFSFVTPQGALSIDTSAGTIDWVTSEKVRFLNGILSMATQGEAFNIAEKVYYYQVI